MSFDLADRILLAHTSLVMTYEQRDGFLSDDDVLDAAIAWSPDLPTLSDPDYYLDDETFHALPAVESFHDLREALYALLTDAPEESAS